MSDWNDLVRMAKSSGRMPLIIIRYPSSRYGFVGSIPFDLTHEAPSLYEPHYRASNIYETEQEAITAVLALGIEQFQLSDCSWYGPHQASAK